jgi:hypothetical protein
LCKCYFRNVRNMCVVSISYKNTTTLEGLVTFLVSHVLFTLFMIEMLQQPLPIGRHLI